VTYGKLRFRPEIGVRPIDLTECVRDLEARLRMTELSQLTQRETQALNELLQTVQALTEPSRFGAD
jgi:hypothetical protein